MQPQAESDYRSAIDDFYLLAQTIDRLISEEDEDEAQKLFARAKEQVKCIATLHCNYHQEIFAQEDALLRKNGLKRILTPTAYS